MTALDCLVVGAGIHGLCTAFWLRQRGVRRVAVLEQFGPGHGSGSSHGQTRITRCSYDDPELVALAARATDEGWPALERAVGRPLRLPTPGVFFGPADGPIAGYERATRAAGAAVVPMAVAAARAAFPLLRFGDGDLVLRDDTAAVVLAAAAMASLRAWLTAAGVALQWQTRVEALHLERELVRADTSGGTVLARHVVLACGPWSGRLAAPPAPLTVVRQEVGWFDVDAAPAACAPGRFPVWARIGRDADDFTYGLPDVDGAGLKAARHRTAGPGGDPDATPPAIDVAALLAVAAERFACTVRGLRASEPCLYTMAPGQRLLVVTAPRAPITTIAACSGHAFKFGPVIGRLAADRVLAS